VVFLMKPFYLNLYAKVILNLKWNKLHAKAEISK
jgi:hypothetical protein